MLETPIGRVRAAGLVEGVSALVLFFVAMPLKYAPPAGSETALLGKQVVFYVGAVHGGLFILYAIITFIAWGAGALRFKHVAMAAAAAIVPFGPFVIDRRLKAVEEQPKPATTNAPQPTPHPEQVNGNLRAEILDLVRQLKTHQLQELCFRLKIPPRLQPPDTISHKAQSNAVLRWADEEDRLDDLRVALLELIGGSKQS
ncbi:MAG: DUF3817 domain-containing protein [Planctomycetes bacterium]|nr:DUF3817 domain-containing protein [Planctomycetota bacterium]